jgi:omega-6 fatty acid desaturase (delta-12 desaturase)
MPFRHTVPQGAQRRPDPVDYVSSRLPGRKEIRSWLTPLESKGTAGPVALFLFDGTAFLALVAAAVLSSAWWLQLVLSVLSGVWIARLFVLGHDACHQAYTPSRRLNRLLGRLAFLPSLTPYSLWEVGHNVVHHGYTNLKGVDFVWAPLSPQEYAALPAPRRLLERAYRSGWGMGLYYLIEIWWRRLYFPNRTEMPTRRPVFRRDNLLVSTAGVAWLVALAALAWATGRSPAWTLFIGFLLPMAVWTYIIGFVVYVHHTHEEVQWYDDKGTWSRMLPFVSTTVHLTFPFGVGTLLHHIMEHTAHHVSMSVPLYRLKQAQALLEHKLPGAIVVQRFSWRWYRRTVRLCKLYDFSARRWVPFPARA